jgi:adenosylhomocysteine nucleosidase
VTDRLVVCGLSAESRIAAGPGIRVIAGGGNSTLLAAKLAALDPAGLEAVISFGVAGALDPSLKPGDLVIATGIVAGETLECDDGLKTRLMARLEPGQPLLAPIAGVDLPVLKPDAKAALHASTGAAAVDMESHLAAAYAARHALPFAAIRVISDSAAHVLPPVAALAMKPDGGIAIGRVVAGLLRHPGQVPALLATARDAGTAFKALRRIRMQLGAGFGLH